jgi:hypothetical protein
MLGRYRRGSSYVIPRGEAQELLTRLGQLCESLHKRRKKRGGVRRALRRRDAQVVSFYIAEDELAALDKYAEEAGITRSDVIRLAVMRLIEKLKAS